MGTPIISVTVFLYILGAIIALLLIWIVRLEIKLQRFLKGSDARSLEESFVHMKSNVEKQVLINQEIAKEIDKIDARVQKSLRGFETVRFNAFKGTGSGGNQSFALALINEDNDGVVLSSLYSRDHFSAFAKPISHGKSLFELTEEEQTALTKAQNNL